jgi:hypothetical protein
MRLDKTQVRVRNLSEFDQDKEDLEYWLTKTPEERVAAVEFLRKQFHGDLPRLQRVARLIKRPRS